MEFVTPAGDLIGHATETLTQSRLLVGALARLALGGKLNLKRNEQLRSAVAERVLSSQCGPWPNTLQEITTDGKAAKGGLPN